MTSLSSRIESGTGDQRELLEEAFAAVFPRHYRPGHSGIGPSRYLRFLAMLNAEAYLSAAEMLVPEGWAWSITYERERELSGNNPYFADMRHSYRTSYDRTVHCWVSTPALALAAASLKAKEQSHD